MPDFASVHWPAGRVRAQGLVSARSLGAASHRRIHPAIALPQVTAYPPAVAILVAYYRAAMHPSVIAPARQVEGLLPASVAELECRSMLVSVAVEAAVFAFAAVLESAQY